MAHSAQEPEELDRADEERGDRMRWNRDNQAKFEAAVEAAGGVLHAMPRAILDSLRLPGVSYAQVKSHLQRYRTAYVADCLARGEVVDVSEAQLRASQALLEKRAAAASGSGATTTTSSRRRPASSMQRSDGDSPPPSQLRQRPRSDSVAPAPMATDGGGSSAGMPAERAVHGWAAAAAEVLAGAAGRRPMVRPSGSGEGCDTEVSGSEQASEPLQANSLAAGGRRGSTACAPAGAAAAAAAAAAAIPAATAPAAAAVPLPLGMPAAAPQQAGAAAKLESLLERVQQLHAASDLLVAQMAEQQRQHQRAWQAMQQALQTLQRECVEAIVEARHGPAGGMPALQQQQQQQPQAGGLQGGGGAPSEAQLLQTLIALSSQQLPPVQQPAQPALPPLQLGSQGGLWEQRLRAQLTGGQGGGTSGINSLGPGISPFQPVQPNSLGPQPPAAQPQQQAQQQAAPQPQQQAGQQAGQQAQQGALPVDDAVSMLLNCFPAPAGGSGAAAIGSDLEALLKSSGSESGDSLLGSLLRAAGGQPGVDDLAAMLSSL